MLTDNFISCRAFVEQECNDLWLSVDGLVGNFSDKGEQKFDSAGSLVQKPFPTK